MKTLMVTTLTVLVAGMFLITVALADDADDIKTAETAHFAALSAGDVDVITQHHLAGHTGFPPEGGLLERFDSLEEERNNLRAQFDAGLKQNLQLRHLEVKIYGNLTAVTTGYVVGTVTAPDGTTQQVNGRRTAVLIKQGGQWKEVHAHNSPLSLAQ